ncbi:hypothetical protein BN1110_04818 [bacterium YEK0313]|nr:hypothetical protein BN1110_04818 [bacterium YEK0313]
MTASSDRPTDRQVPDQPLGTADRTFGRREAYPRDTEEELGRVVASDPPDERVVMPPMAGGRAANPRRAATVGKDRRLALQFAPSEDDDTGR